MKRSQVNEAVREAAAFFQSNGWTLPPDPAWDVTDFGLGHFKSNGLVLVNLANETEYCEKLMFAVKNQQTPAHCHQKKKEDIICRKGELMIQVWPEHPEEADFPFTFQVQVNNTRRAVRSGEVLRLTSGERITLEPGIYHAYYPESEGCIIGEVSTANDDLNDNFFLDPGVGRYPKMEEDEPPLVRLVYEKI